jgi:N utilization substance protein B
MTRRMMRILAFQALFAWEAGRGGTSGGLSGNSRDVGLLAEFSWRSAKKEKPSTVRFDDDAGREDDLTFPRLLFFGAIEHIDEIDDIIRNHLVGWEFARVSKVDLAILRLGVYTLLFQRDIPFSIAINEAVDIAKEFSGDESYKFVNAVLDAVRKENDLPS